MVVEMSSTTVATVPTSKPPEAIPFTSRWPQTPATLNMDTPLYLAGPELNNDSEVMSCVPNVYRCLFTVMLHSQARASWLRCLIFPNSTGTPLVAQSTSW